MKIIGELTFATIILIGLTILISFFFLIIFTIKALIKYVKSKDIKKKNHLLKKSLGEVLKQHREECKMTQEFVAEAIGVSRQAVSKWENGTSDPNTSNLIVLSKLFKISPEELLDEIQ